MIVNRYDPVNLFEMVPKLKLEMEPVSWQGSISSWRMMSSLRESEPIFASATPRFGAARTPFHARCEVILRMLVVKRLYNWSYEQTEHFISDSIVLRQFCRLYLEDAPEDTTLIRWANPK